MSENPPYLEGVFYFCLNCDDEVVPVEQANGRTKCSVCQRPIFAIGMAGIFLQPPYYKSVQHQRYLKKLLKQNPPPPMDDSIQPANIGEAVAGEEDADTISIKSEDDEGDRDLADDDETPPETANADIEVISLEDE